ncbi:invasin domain 3-containing protein [Serratia ureilytica]|uniref:Ig-like domain-containing protein n=1 Tax=Serratia ureilytica TaxID=300181 RepID=UPI00313C46FD
MKEFRDCVPFRIKLLTWLNIAVQAAFPLAASFTPSVAGAGSDGRFLQRQAQTGWQTRVYTLGEGESVSSVAKKYNMPLDSLRTLNQFRTFTRGFDHLQPGDELDVPVAPLPEVRWDDAPAASVHGQNNEDTQAQQVAGYASQAGSFLANSPNGDAAASMARGMATGAAGAEIQQWLSRFGTARVQLDADKNFSLKNSQLDLLVPLYEQKDRLVFTQGSLHRTDDRTQSNLGLGYRWFAGDWMLGANTFLDYDLSRDHARAGVGLEYWRDFLKLGVNSYHRLTGWKNAPDLEDYEARPANGWDIRAQYWLPALPQLGGKLTYEQYYGDEVALFGKDNRQRNPYAVTAGVSYTPVPLLTFSAEQRQGQSGKSDIRFGVDMSYQLGVPWQHQINPDAVAAMRSLAGSRYDLVERNNNIVLEYRKKEVIRLKTADLVTGYAGEQKSLGVSVNSKYGLERIDWSASPLIAAGGKIVQSGNAWAVVMPTYRSGAKGVNSYTVSGVAVDKKGNRSNQAETQVTVTQAAIDKTTSSLSPSAATLPADGVSQQEFVLKVNDKEGQPVDIAENEISVEKASRLRGSSNATVSAFTRRAPGEYVMTVTSGTIPEAFTVTPSARNTKFASADIKLTADNATAMVHSLDVVENNAIADGKSQNKFRITVVDAQSNPVPGQSVSLQADNSASVAESVITEADGTVIVPVTSPLAGEATVTASINNKGSKTLKLSFRPDQNTARIEQKDLSVLPEVSLADGKTEKTVSARVTDAKGNTVPDALVTFSADNGAVLAEEKVKTDNHGLVTTTMTSTNAGIAHVTASVNNQSVSKETTFTGNNATANVISVETTTTSGVADGVTAVTFRALIKDQNGNPLSGIPVDWKSNKDSSIVAFNDTQTVTSGEGIAEVRVTSTRAYSDVVVTASTNASSKAASPFIFVADKQNPVIKAFSSNKQTVTANGIDSAELTVSITDTHGNPLSGIEVSLSNSNNAGTTPSHLVTDANGVASASLVTNHAGKVTVTASLKNGGEKSLAITAVSDEQTAKVNVTASTTSATAGQANPVILTATVVDVNNNPVSGTSVAWQTSHNHLSDTVSQTNAEGKATVQLTGTEAVLTTITAVLYNGKKGSTQVTFGPGKPENEHSQLSVSPQTITADGQSKALASLILRDRWDNPVSGKAIDWSADTKSGIHFAPVEKGEGVYQAVVTGTAEGAWTLKAQSGVVDLQVPLTLLANQNTAQIDSVAISGLDTVKADGQEYVTLRAQVKDKNGNTKLKNVAVGWSTTLGTLSSSLSRTDENGVAEIMISSRAAGSAWVSAMLGGGASHQANKAVTFTAGDISAGKSSLSISPSSIIAAKESATLSVTARDAEGNLLPGLKDKINAGFTPDLNMTVSAFSEVSPGTYAASVSGKKAGTSQVSADVSGIRINHTASITLQADNDTARVKGSISVTPASATVNDVVTYAAVLTDINENALGAGIPVTWSANEGSTLSAQMTRTDDSGTARVTLSRKLAGVAKVELILPSGTTSAPDVIFSAGDVDENRSELTLAPSVIVAGKETATLTLTLRDSNGNPLPGKSVSGHSDSDVTIGESHENSSAPGRYTMTVTGNKAGNATLTAYVGNVALNKSRILTVKGDTDSWKLSAVTPDKTSLTAGDTKGVTYSAAVTDAKGNPLNNVVVSWHLRGQAESYAPTSRTNEKGIATTTVKSHTAGLLQMTAYLDADNHIQAENVTVVAGDVKNATFSADKTSIGSDGKDKVTFTTSLEDNWGNPVMGKTVIIKGADSLAGFKLSEVQDQQNGRYVATGTSTTKGQVTLSAHVDGKKVGNSVTVTVGAITPDLRFDNAQQETTWTKNFNASQSVRGMPEGLKQIWYSSDETVATVSNAGKVTLNKSGEVRITVYTPGNEQYYPAMASYTLKVNKAQPQLIFGSGEHQTTYGSNFTLPAVKSAAPGIDLGDLTITYSSSEPAVSDIDNLGVIKIKKSGSVKFYAKATEDDRFEASETDYVLVVAKAKLPISFSNSLKKINVQQMHDDSTVYWQEPVQRFPKDAIVEVFSGNVKVLKVNTDGAVEMYSPGTTRIKLSVKEDERYEASTGDYDLNIYGKPVMSITSIQGTSLGQLVDLSHQASQEWQPYFIDDELQISWSSDVNPYYLPEKVSVKVSEGDKLLEEKSYGKGETSSGITKIKAQAAWVGKSLTVSASGYGFANIESEKVSKGVNVSVVDVSNVISSATAVLKHDVYLWDGSKDSENTCRSTSLVGRRDVYLDYNISIVPKFPGRTTLFGHDIDAYINSYTRTNDGGNTGWDKSMGSVGNGGGLRFRSSGSGVNKETRLAYDCWKNHVGGMDDQGRVTARVEIKYGGKKFTLRSSPMTWSGDSGASNQPSVNLTVE